MRHCRPATPCRGAVHVIDGAPPYEWPEPARPITDRQARDNESEPEENGSEGVRALQRAGRETGEGGALLALFGFGAS